MALQVWWDIVNKQLQMRQALQKRKGRNYGSSVRVTNQDTEVKEKSPSRDIWDMKDEKDLIRAFVCAAEGQGHMRYHWPCGLGSSTCQPVIELSEVQQSLLRWRLSWCFPKAHLTEDSYDKTNRSTTTCNEHISSCRWILKSITTVVKNSSLPQRQAVVRENEELVKKTQIEVDDENYYFI